MRRQIPFALVLLAILACERPAAPPPPASPIKMTGPLIAASMSMKAGWEFPQNPLTEKTLDKSKLSDEIRRGFASSRILRPRRHISRRAVCRARIAT
jgi:hypothetical protein